MAQVRHIHVEPEHMEQMRQDGKVVPAEDSPGYLVVGRFIRYTKVLERGNHTAAQKFKTPNGDITTHPDFLYSSNGLITGFGFVKADYVNPEGVYEVTVPYQEPTT